MCRPSVDVSDYLTVETLAEWLAWRFSREELAAEVKRTLEEAGPRLPGAMKRDLDQLIDDQARGTLARCLAMNEDPSEREEFVDWCREQAGEPADAYARHGVRRSDFCAGTD